MPTFRDPSGVWRTFVAGAYALVATVAGLYYIACSREASFLAGAAAVLALAHGRIIAAYIVHECAHSSIFFERKWNTALGTAMLWVSGCPYCDFDHVKKLHVMHHVDRADTTSFEYKHVLRAQPKPVRNTILALEYCFVPIVETLMHTYVALYPIFAIHDTKVTSHGPYRRTSAAMGSTAIAALWLTLFAQGGLYALALNYAAAALMLHVLMIHDAFQHTYIVLADDDTYVAGPGNRTAQYEDSNTYSNLISKNYPMLNLLSLNFGYHNAHHAKPMSPWYKLPAVHDALYSEEKRELIPMAELMGTWFRNRIARAIDDDYGVVGEGPRRTDNFIGSLGVSFLTV